MSEELADMQKGDETLVALRKAVEKTTSVGSGFFILIYYGCPWALQYWIVQSQKEFDGVSVGQKLSWLVGSRSQAMEVELNT